MHFNSFHEHIMLLIQHFYFVWTEYSNKCHIIIHIYIYHKYRKTIWTDLSNSNSSRPVLQISQCIRQTSLNAPLRAEMCPSPFWTVHRRTLPRHHWGHRWLSIWITPSARRRLAPRLKVTSRGGKWPQMVSFSRKMSPSAFSRRCQAPPGGETAQMARHVKAGRWPRPGWTSVASFTKEVNLWLAKRPMKTNGRLANLEL